MKQIRTLFLVATLVTTLVPAASAEAATEPTVTFFGGGFGHAIGMSQYGAYEMAAKGKSADEILSFYYTGVDPSVDHTTLTTVAPPLAVPNPSVWVGLAQDVSSITFSVPSVADGGGPVELCQANDDQGATCPRADAVPQAGDTWKLTRVSGSETRCVFSRVEPDPTPFAEGDCRASVTWGGLDQAESITVDGTSYADGTLRIRQGIQQQQAGLFHVSLDIPIEEYLLGLREVPLHWPAAALEAQAIAGRTYALEKVNRLIDWNEAELEGYLPAEGSTPGRRSDCFCHIYDSTIDQNYRGMDNEQLNAAVYPDWQAAVLGTGGQVVAHEGKLIQAFYSSSTGGFTENSEDVFVTPLPYLVSKADPWSATSINSLATWKITVPISQIESALGLDEITNVTLANPAPNAAMVVTGMKDDVAVTETYKIARQIKGTFPRYGYYSLDLLSPSVSGLAFNPDGGVGGSFAFTDISDSIHAADINAIAALGITKGCDPPDNTLFCPKDSVTRGQMAAFLSRALQLGSVGDDYFTDDEDSVFEGDINRLVAVAGLDLACGTDSFCPNELIRRDEMALFLQRTLGLEGTGPVAFVDVSGNSHEAEINVIGNLGISKGCNPPDNDQFCPERTVLRQEMASFLVRTLNHLDQQ